MEDLLALGVLALLLLGVHIAFFVYLYRSQARKQKRSDEPIAGVESIGEPNASASNSTAPEQQDETDSSEVACPVCGARNDPAFQFCRRCVSDLSDTTTASGGGVNRSRS